MRQFYIFLINAVLVSVLDLIDSAFGNSISVDSICVLSAFTIIYWTVNVVCRVGEYAYKIKMGDESNCLALNIISTAICSAILILGRNIIPRLYDLTEVQYELFSLCLLYKGIFLMVSKLESFIYQYITLKCMNKQMITGNIIFYTSMIITDAMVVIGKGECYHLVLATGICDLIVTIYYVVFCQVLKNFKLPDKKGMWDCFLCAKDLLIDRMLGKVATITFAVCASHLGTVLYAIHSVAYTIATSTEEVTNCLYTNQVVQLQHIDNIKQKHDKSVALAKKMFVPATLVVYMVAILLIIPLKGDLEFGQVFSFVLMYATQCILIQLYENYRGFLTSCKTTKVMRYAGLVGIIVRVPIALIGGFTPVGIYAFAFGSGIDFLFRGLYYRRESLKIVKKSSIEQ